ncbi:hypothetical protein, partial [Streptomyces coeruleoprunus]
RRHRAPLGRRARRAPWARPQPQRRPPQLPPPEPQQEVSERQERVRVRVRVPEGRALVPPQGREREPRRARAQRQGPQARVQQPELGPQGRARRQARVPRAQRQQQGPQQVQVAQEQEPQQAREPREPREPEPQRARQPREPEPQRARQPREPEPQQARQPREAPQPREAEPQAGQPPVREPQRVRAQALLVARAREPEQPPVPEQPQARVPPQARQAEPRAQPQVPRAREPLPAPAQPPAPAWPSRPPASRPYHPAAHPPYRRRPTPRDPTRGPRPKGSCCPRGCGTRPDGTRACPRPCSYCCSSCRRRSWWPWRPGGCDGRGGGDAMKNVVEMLALGLVAALVAAGVVLAWHHFRPSDAEEGDRREEVAEYMSMMIALLYAMLLGLALVTVWTIRDSAETHTAAEAGALHQMTMLADGLPADQHRRVDVLAERYATAVVQDEWPRLNERQALGEQGWFLLGELRAAAAPPPDASPAQQVTALEMLAQLGALDDARRGREATGQEALSPVLWAGLVLGAILSVCILFFFGIGRSPSQLVMAMGMVALTVFLGFLIHQLSLPFGEVAGVGPEPFTRYFPVSAARGQ